MNSVTLQNEQQEIRLLVSKINQAWLKGNLEELKEYFHDDMVIKGPQFKSMGTGGKEACIKSYEDFLRAAKIHDFKESDIQVDVFASTAIATFAWEIKYEMKGQNYHEAGHDVFVFIRDEGKWQAVWRAVLFSPAKE
ncbi:MAG: nuclear transport factor 2 family protein [Terriglobia bacterium]|jgi:ketosteroid isomerase-like protein